MVAQSLVAMPWPELTKLLVDRLRGRGLAVRTTFDLQSARAEMRHPARCTCPRHGAEACGCQLLVLLVSGRASQLAVVVHGDGDRTKVSLSATADEVARHPGGADLCSVLEELTKR